MKRIILTGNLFFYLLFCTSLALMWFFHKDATRFNDRHELWSDRAGYYIYLPAVFFYHFNATEMPGDLDIQTGGGFATDTLRNKIDTKYTYGVALLASPFFITAGVVSRLAGIDSEHGFSMLYMRMMGLAAVVYLILGLWFLKRFLDNYFASAVSNCVVLALFFGTNLFYYSLIDGMMSHVYSFFLFSVYLFALKRFIDTTGRRYFLLMALAFSLAVLVRPTSILIGILFFFWDAAGPKEWLNRLRLLLKPFYLFSLIGMIIVLFLPQMIYWKYLSGHWLHFSYVDEGFTNWRHPRIAEVLFSPLNGLFAHVPFAFLFVAGILLMIFTNKKNGCIIALVFAAVTMICASWKMWYFGCSFGQRSYIEYFTVFAVPLGWLLTETVRNRFFLVRTIVFFLVLFLVYFNLRLTIVSYRFDRCWFGSAWDWEHYSRTIEKCGIISPLSKSNSVVNDFENLAFCPVSRPSAVFTRSGQASIATVEKSGITPLYEIILDELGYPWPKVAEVEIWMLRPGKMPTGASLSFSVTNEDKVLFTDEEPVDSVLRHPLTWSLISRRFIVPDVNDSSIRIRLAVKNPKHALFYLDDLKIKYIRQWK